MKTSDLSPAMIGQTVRIVSKGIAGTHNYIEGTLSDFSFDASLSRVHGYSPVRRGLSNLEATVAGLDFSLTGNEELVASPVFYE